MVTVATWNVNSLKVRQAHLQGWLADTQPDVLALQETKTQDGDFPTEFFARLGYQVVSRGQKTYNGVAVACRQPPTVLADALPDFADPQRRLLHVATAGLEIINVYVPNGAVVDSEKYAYKLRWLAALDAYLATLASRSRPLIVLGDFNIAPADADVHDPTAWAGQVLVSPAERTALQGLLARGLVDCFRLSPQPAGEFSWWDYRQGGFRRNHGLRIDLILANAAAGCQTCHIDRTPRGWERPSDHAPVVASFVPACLPPVGTARA